MFFKVNTTGVSERKGLVEVRYDLYLDPTDERYSEHYVQVPVIPKEGYPRQKEYDAAYQTMYDEFKAIYEEYIASGRNLDVIKKAPKCEPLITEIELYDKWFSELERVYQHNPFCCHFCQFEPTVTDAEIEYVGKLALDMKYKDWVNQNLALSKNQPVTFSTSPKKIAACATRVATIKVTEWTAVKLEK
jgi:hypothetical protein